ncbi:reductase [Fusarium coicis]|nr:reductase [Fusarium coicis]
MSRYADAHKNTCGPGDARPTALQIVRDEGLEGALTDKAFLITGTSAGIGVEVGCAIAATGARIFLAVRDLEKGKAACSSFLKPGRVDLIRLDTSDMSSVRACATEFLEKSPTLNVLINNAAIMATPTRIKTKDGFGQQLATNYLGHFLLFWLLRDTLLKGSTPEFNSRVVNVSSSGHHASEIIYDDFQLKEPDAYSPFKAYGQSKLAQIYMSNYIDRVHGPKGLHATSVMPGGIASNLQKHMPESVLKDMKEDPKTIKFMKVPRRVLRLRFWQQLVKNGRVKAESTLRTVGHPSRSR